MKKRMLWAVIGCVALLVACESAENDKTGSSEPSPVSDYPLFFVAEYDPTRDPAADLTNAVDEAQQSNRRILLDIGGDWCGWCHILDEFIEQRADINQALRQNFVILKVNYSQENFNDAFLQQFPAAAGYPHFYILESDGTFLHSQNTAELEEGQSYNPAVFMAFIEQWKPQS
ncbi:MAG: thioredoxin family protein [Anaerolineae bacterium]|nr:thioredoxin family protein [Anaerolineae bacterium]